MHACNMGYYAINDHDKLGEVNFNKTATAVRQLDPRCCSASVDDETAF
jgi:hypothetical protein